jgi:hypothetical protein
MRSPSRRSLSPSRLMLIPRSHALTATQKWLVVGAVILGAAVLSTLIYTYERYYRGLGESALYGTWQVPDVWFDDPVYLQLNPGQTFSMGGVFEGKLNPLATGKWYAGGPNIYLRFSADVMGERRPLILHIADIQADEFRVRTRRDGEVLIFRRAHLDSASASNQAMQRTADRRGERLRDEL